ncbi:unnamed protein product, partial [Brugia timori]|uniref:DNA-directed DNA polymerase n=1 Tax=Brugia timori TaxID=42155 RepID=A0A0R3Q6P2_9BILA
MTFKIKETVNPLDSIARAFTQVLEYGKRKAKAQDKVGVTLQNDNNARKPIYISFRRADQIDVELLFQQIEAVIQSDETFLALGPHHLKLTIVEAIDGKGRIRNKIADATDVSRLKKSIVKINNSDNLCLPRALVTGIALLQKAESAEKKNNYNNLRDGRPAQKREAEKLCRDSGVDISRLGGGIEALKVFQAFLKDYKITVYQDTSAKNIIFEEKENISQKYIDLFYHNNHYDLINSITGFVGNVYYCRFCRVNYSVKTSHKCPNSCKKCLKSPPCLPDGSISQQCGSCKLFFPSRRCIGNHFLPHFPNNKSVCDTIKYCTECRRVYSLERIKQHKCGYSKCSICHCYLPSTHLCHIQPLKKKDEEKKSKVFVFYDFECRQDEIRPGGIRPHIINFAVLQIQCVKCLSNNNLEEDCVFCGRREYVIPSID